MSISLVVTTIQAPNAVMRSLAQAASRAGAGLHIMGDRKSPPGYRLDGADYLTLEQQHERFGDFSRALPVGHYVRKNLGYLAALEAGAEWIVETDDDNFPLENFFERPQPGMRARLIRSQSPWVNVCNWFGPSLPVWPRGFPLEALAGSNEAAEGGRPFEIDPVLVQGLADDNPDVDAVYRMTRPLPVRFDPTAAPAVLDEGAWCPFNSQNTWFRRDVAALMYLPAHCSFRMTDIWRSFVAQRCLWAMGQRVVFIAPTVRQERNEHNLLRDFADEVPGYLKNEAIRGILAKCRLDGDPARDLVTCYSALIEGGILPEQELELVNAWTAEVAKRS